ncbi:MAG: hypothetical protein K8U57_29395 [Planctomycetes bacterium]|nr:hypothetical protein [Planctomycetota bacterium]
MSDAITSYHDLLASDSALAFDSQAALEQAQKNRGLMFGTRPICSVLRPRFLTHTQYKFLQDTVKGLLPAFQKTYDRALGDADFRTQFKLTPYEEELLVINPGYRDPSPTSRFDSFFVSNEELLFTEFNTETPAGAGYSDSLAEVFYGMPVFQEFQRNYHVFPLPAKPGVLHALMGSFKQWQGNTSQPPRIAILDWREVPTFSEFVIFYDYFKAMGIEVRIVDPRDCEFRDGKLMAGDYHITLIYKRVLITELLDRGGIEHPVVLAVRAGAVCMVNSFRSKILFKKASLAVLSDERNESMFTADELLALRRHIPWTRVMEQRMTVAPNGSDIELLLWTMGNKDNLVLKPNDDYGGHGITLGWTVDEEQWGKAVSAALDTPHVVQWKVRLPSEAFPSVENGTLHVIDRMLDTNPYVAFGSYMHGCLTRISTDPLVNVTAGGGSTVPTFLVEER